jgi:hypothetical protein
VTAEVNNRPGKMSIKSLLIVIVIILILSFLWYMLYLLPFLLWKAETSEIERLTSPDGKVDAVVTITDAGAVSSMSEIPYEVYLIPTGNVRADEHEPVFIAYSVYGFEVKWLGDKKLLIRYDSKDVYKSDTQSSPLEDDSDYIVEIQTQQFKSNK